MRLPILAAVLLLLFGCSAPNKETRSSSALGYEMKNYKLASRPDCVADSACAIFEVEYPVFSGIDSLVANKVQREIELTFSLGDPEAEGKTLKQIATDFIDSYNSFSKEFPDSPQAWYFNGQAQVKVLLDTLISIEFQEDFYTGGAHGGSGVYFLNINPQNGDSVKLADVLNAGFEQELDRVGEIAFRQARELTPKADFQENGFEFTDNKFSLNDNYGFSNDGITFYYNSYEIAPYAAGPTEVFIPYKEILNWLKNKPVQKTLNSN